MINSRFFAVGRLASATCVCAALLFIAGCNRAGSAPQAMPVEQITRSITQAFQNARGEPKAWSAEFLKAYQAKDLARSFFLLQQLSTSTNLTTDQRKIVARSLLTVGEQVQEAAAKGEGQAGEALQLYRSTK